MPSHSHSSFSLNNLTSSVNSTIHASTKEFFFFLRKKKKGRTKIIFLIANSSSYCTYRTFKPYIDRVLLSRVVLGSGTAILNDQAL